MAKIRVCTASYSCAVQEDNLGRIIWLWCNRRMRVYAAYAYAARLISLTPRHVYITITHFEDRIKNIYTSELLETWQYIN
jgi:hypothetical protein